MSSSTHATTEPASTGLAPDASRGKRLGMFALGAAVLGMVLTVVGALGEDRSRVAHAYLLAAVFCWSVVLGSVFFLALQHSTRSVWSVTVRRVAEMFASPMWLVALLFVPVVLLAVFSDELTVFPWAAAADDAHVQHLMDKKAPYLNVPFFVVRTAVFFLVWVVFAAFFVRGSLSQDDAQGGAGAAATLRMRKFSPLFLLLFAFTVTFASFDWLMSLAPEWFSTIFGVYVFSGMTLAALAAVTLGVVWMRARGWIPAQFVTHDHLYSLGALLFAFTCFWAYIAFSQYMLIWYANLPEETVWFARRLEPGWMGVSWLLIALRFVLPFFLLLGRGSKMDPKRLAVASVIVLVGQLVDLYWLIMPQAGEGGPSFGWQELGPILLLVGLLTFVVSRFLGRRRLVADGDPLFEKSLHFHL